jgi:hypothetical protein
MISCKSMIPVLAFALLAPLAARAAADQVTFRFAPPAGTAYRATSKVTTGLWITTRGKSRVNETEIVARLRHSENGGNGRAGAEQTFSVLSVTSKLDGSPMDNPLAQILPGLDLTFRLGKDGQILDLMNFQEMLDKARKSMPPERFAQISPLVTPEVLLARRRAAANPLVGALAGKTLAVGETSAATGSLALPSGENLPVRFTMTLKARERTPACDCVRIDFKTEPVLQNGRPADLGATGQGTALVDPATLLTWALHHQETILTEEPGARSVMKVDLTVDASLAPER